MITLKRAVLAGVAAAVLILAPCVHTPVLGAVFNVTNSAELRGVLSVAERNGEDDIINIQAGVYDAAGVPFVYDAEEADVPEENFALTIVGEGAAVTTLRGNGFTPALIITTLELRNDRNADITINDLAITQGSGTGAIIATSNADVTLRRVTFADNDTDAGALDIATFTADIVIEQCTFMDNISVLNAGAHLLSDSGGIAVRNSVFQDNTFTAMHVTTDTSDITIADNLINSNNADADSTAVLESLEGDILVERNIITGNDSADFAGALSAKTFIGSIKLMNNIIRDNEGFITGGAYLETFTKTIVLVNNVVVDNVALGADGGGLNIFTNFGTVILTNNTIAQNTDTGNGGGLAVTLIEDEARLSVYNNVFWMNAAELVGQDIFVEDNGNGNNTGSIVAVFNNNFLGIFTTCSTTPGCVVDVTLVDNLPFNPVFINPGAGNFRLSNISPLLDKGTLSAPELPALDIDGNPRSVMSSPDGKQRPDMGAFELLSFVDILLTESSGCSVAQGRSAAGWPVNLALMLLAPLVVVAGRTWMRRRVRG